MNQFSKIFQQAQALFTGMTPQARLLAVLLVAAIGVSTGFLVQGVQSSTAATEYLFGGQSFSDDELDRMEAAFSTTGLSKYDRTGNRIRVPIATRDKYVKALADGKALPMSLNGSFEQAMGANSFLESQSVTDARQRAAKQTYVANTLKKLPFVKNANVTFDENKEGFSAVRKRSVSIAIQPLGGVPLTEMQKRSIITYIEKTWVGTEPRDITLLDMSTGQSIVGSDDPDIESQNQFYRVKAERELELRRKAEQLLFSYGDVRIEVNVELDPTLSEEMEQLNFNEKPTTIQSSTTKKDIESQRAGNGGRPGTEPNALANRSASLGTPAEQSSKTKESSENERRVTGNTLTSTKKAGLQITRASYSVAIPYSYYRKAFALFWQERNPGQPISAMPAVTEADIKQIKIETETSIRTKLTAILQKGAPGEDSFPRVVVTDYPDLPPPEIAGPSMAETAMLWLSSSWQTLALFGLAFTALLSLRSFVRSTPVADDSAFERGFDIPLDEASEIDLESLTQDENEYLAPPEDDEASTIKLRTTGGEIKDELTNIVRENPDAAATLLRSWIASGS